MIIPAAAFAEIEPTELVAGQLFLFRGCWALRATVDESHEGFLVLEGDRAGSMGQMAPGMGKVVAIVAPFSWFPMLSNVAKPAIADDPVCNLALTTEGPLIVCLDGRDDWGRSYLAIAPSGRGTDANEVRRAPQFATWSVALCHQDRPFVSLATLLEIDRRNDT